MIERRHDSLVIIHPMQRSGPELRTTGHLNGIGIEFGVGVEFPVDDGRYATLGADLCQELVKDAITKPIEALDLPPAPQISRYLSGDLADGLECAGFWGTAGHYASQRQTRRWRP